MNRAKAEKMIAITAADRDTYSDRPLLVGELNLHSRDFRYDLFPQPPHCSGGRLAKILKMSPLEYLRTFDRVNLCRGFWSPEKARAAARLILSRRRTTIILLGKKVAAAFGIHGDVLFREYPRQDAGTIYIIPHPSGLNRVWNTEENTARVRTIILHARLEVIGGNRG